MEEQKVESKPKIDVLQALMPLALNDYEISNISQSNQPQSQQKLKTFQKNSTTINSQSYQLNDEYKINHLKQKNEEFSQATLVEDTANKKDKYLSRKFSTIQEVINNPDGLAHNELNTMSEILEQKQQKKKQLDRIQNYYDPDKIPPNFDLAEDHRLATITGKDLAGEELETEEMADFCQCCARQIQKKLLPLNCDNHDFAFLGSGYPLYFDYIQQCGEILITLLIFSGIFNIITNSMGKSCIRESEMEQQGDQKMKIADEECDKNDIAANDYTILLQNIPREYNALNDDYDDDLKDFLENKIDYESDIKIVVKEINLCYNLKDYTALKLKKSQFIEKKKKIITYFNKNNKYPENESLEAIDQQLSDVKKEILDLLLKYQNGSGKKFMADNFIGMAFVQVQTEQSKEFLIEKYSQIGFIERTIFRKKNNHMIYKGQQLILSQAPDPNDIEWENLYYSDNNRLVRELLALFIILCLLILFIYILWELGQIQQKAGASDGKDNASIQILALVVSLFVTGSNAILRVILSKIATILKLHTKTELNIEIGKYVSVSQFINSGIAPLLLQVIVYANNQYGKVFGSAGLVYNMLYVFLINAIVSPFLQYIDWEKQFYKFRRLWYMKDKKGCVLTQQELNKIWQNPEFRIAERYAVCLNTMFIVGFFASIMPICILLGLLALYTQYKVDKYNFLRTKTNLSNLGRQLSHEMIEQLEYFLPIYSMSSLIFSLIMFEGKAPIESYIGLLVGILHAFLPMQKFNEIFFKIDKAPPNEQKLEQVKETFLVDYATENPSTSELARQQKIDKMKAQQRLKRATQQIMTFKSSVQQFQNQLNIKQLKSNLSQSIISESSSDGSSCKSKVSKHSSQKSKGSPMSKRSQKSNNIDQLQPSNNILVGNSNQQGLTIEYHEKNNTIDTQNNQITFQNQITPSQRNNKLIKFQSSRSSLSENIELEFSSKNLDPQEQRPMSHTNCFNYEQSKRRALGFSYESGFLSPQVKNKIIIKKVRQSLDNFDSIIKKIDNKQIKDVKFPPHNKQNQILYEFSSCNLLQKQKSQSKDTTIVNQQIQKELECKIKSFSISTKLNNQWLKFQEEVKLQEISEFSDIKNIQSQYKRKAPIADLISISDDEDEI